MRTILFSTIMVLTFGFVKAQCNDIVFKITDGKLEKHSISGSYKGKITSEVSDYDCNSEMVVVVKYDGRVEKYSFSGSYIGLITKEAEKARISGDIVLVTKTNGKIEKYSFSGSYKGRI